MIMTTIFFFFYDYRKEKAMTKLSLGDRTAAWHIFASLFLLGFHQPPMTRRLVFTHSCLTINKQTGRTKATVSNANETPHLGNVNGNFPQSTEK